MRRGSCKSWEATYANCSSSALERDNSAACDRNSAVCACTRRRNTITHIDLTVMTIARAPSSIRTRVAFHHDGSSITTTSAAERSNTRKDVALRNSSVSTDHTPVMFKRLRTGIDRTRAFEPLSLNRAVNVRSEVTHERTLLCATHRFRRTTLPLCSNGYEPESTALGRLSHCRSTGR